ncbi:3-phosphoshikimate 1-carboxyvinyltransferase [Crossiella equi]|uniref:3-phosphoshikimate 1-carboxyvinyltransferase n=1 Tax=Crossiella equi TaxID=130796 RepID=A0ABS5A700_9PSEU|nr:3-phosphoshikimate 1-carboxyvinyltransferase [Crossiella equi]MBP2472373.1 3-phosphoshikimate 1-carboxyvinyltransferase [Crossiella equi]
MRLLVKQAVDELRGELVVPPSKYHAHRALILASLAPGSSRIVGLSDAGHVRHTIAALRALGTGIEVDGEDYVVHGGQYRPRRAEVSVGSSGTTLYFLTGLAALASEPVTVIGQKYFQRRPIGPLLGALSEMGLDLSSPTGCPPISVRPGRPTGGHVRIQGTLSQWISGLLLIAPFGTGPTVITVEGEYNERSYVELTIRMMRQFGLRVEETGRDGQYYVEGNQQPVPTTFVTPPDIGSAAFGLAATALHPSDVLFRGLPASTLTDVDHPEGDLLKIIGDMGLPMAADPKTGFIRVRHNGIRLKPTRVDCRSVPDMLPILSVLGSVADGETTFDNVAHVRLKESDRVSAMMQLNQMGANLSQGRDTLVCRGVTELRGADLSSFNDHRVLMSLAVAGTLAEGETRLTYPSAYRISYPRFLEEMNGIGTSMSVATGRETRAHRSEAAAPNPARAARTTAGQYLRRWAAKRPEQLAVVDPGQPGTTERTWTWRQLDEQADRLATALLDLGVAPGEAVAYQLPNQGEFVALAMAIARIGAVSCPLMPMLREREITFMLSRARARVLLVPREFKGRPHQDEVTGLLARGELPGLAHVVVLDGEGGLPTGTPVSWHHFADLAATPADAARLAGRVPAPDATAQLLFTSGTSGEPKGVLHSMDTLTKAVAMEVRHLGLSTQDKIFIPSPLAHQTGFLYGMWLALVLGVPMVLQPVWQGRRALELVRRHGATFVQAATPFLSDLVDAVEETGEGTPSLRVFVATGATVPRGLAERATRVLDAAVCGAWGTTETCLGSLSAPGDQPAKTWGTDGRALAGIRLRITDDEGNVLPRGAEGNFEVLSPCRFLGYLDRPEWTAEAVTADGWYRSGDLAVLDETGYVRISGRAKDIINRGGEKVPVGEIEQLLHTHPSVRDVAIVAMPDPRLGERACAFVVAQGDLDFAGMRHFLDEHRVAKPYWPERLELVDALPRNPTGKVQKFLLRERINDIINSEDGA